MINVYLRVQVYRYVYRMNTVASAVDKTILCTIDFSESTGQSITWAVAMAQQLHAHLVVLYVYRLNKPRGEDSIMLKRGIESEALRKFKTLEQSFLSDKGVDYEFRMEVGFISDRIEDHAKRYALSFVVIPLNVKSGNNETFEELLEHIHVPILVVP